MLANLHRTAAPTISSGKKVTFRNVLLEVEIISIGCNWQFYR